LTYLYVVGPSDTLSGSVTNLTGLTCLVVQGTNTLSGSITNIAGLTEVVVTGSNTISGSIAGFANLFYFYVTGSNTITGWETVAVNCPALCDFYQRGNTVLTSAQVNAVLAGFRANSGTSHPAMTTRLIDLKNTGNGVPTGQGITDKSYLQSYHTLPENGPWTVNTN